MSRKSLLSNLAPAFLGAAIMICIVSIANATTLTYQSFLNTPLGAPMTDIVLYAGGDGQEDRDITSVARPGSFELTHEVDFLPSEALVLGVTTSTPSGRRTGGYDLMMFVNGAFAANAFGIRFDDLFGVAERDIVSLLQALHADPTDTSRLNDLNDFIHGSVASAAYFDPAAPFRVIHWSAGTPGTSPNLPPSPFSASASPDSVSRGGAR